MRVRFLKYSHPSLSAGVTFLKSATDNKTADNMTLFLWKSGGYVPEDSEFYSITFFLTKFSTKI